MRIENPQLVGALAEFAEERLLVQYTNRWVPPKVITHQSRADLFFSFGFSYRCCLLPPTGPAGGCRAEGHQRALFTNLGPIGAQPIEKSNNDLFDIFSRNEAKQIHPLVLCWQL